MAACACPDAAACPFLLSFAARLPCRAARCCWCARADRPIHTTSIALLCACMCAVTCACRAATRWWRRCWTSATSCAWHSSTRQSTAHHKAAGCVAQHMRRQQCTATTRPQQHMLSLMAPQLPLLPAAVLCAVQRLLLFAAQHGYALPTPPVPRYRPHPPPARVFAGPIDPLFQVKVRGGGEGGIRNVITAAVHACDAAACRCSQLTQQCCHILAPSLLRRTRRV